MKRALFNFDNTFRFFMNCQKAQLLRVCIHVLWSARRISTISWCKRRWPPFRALFRVTTAPWPVARVPLVFVLIKKALVRTAASQYTKLLRVTTTSRDGIGMEHLVKTDTLNSTSRKTQTETKCIRKPIIKENLKGGTCISSVVLKSLIYDVQCDLLLHEW